MHNDKICTRCGQTGHRASNCPIRVSIFPLRPRDALWIVVLVALIAAASALKLELGHA